MPRPLSGKQARLFCYVLFCSDAFVLMHLQRYYILPAGRVFRVFFDLAPADWLASAGNYSNADCVH